jgi:MscS family membrane protein
MMPQLIDLIMRRVLSACLIATLLTGAKVMPAAAQPSIKTILNGNATVEKSPAEGARSASSGPQDDLRRGVPRTAVEGFLSATRKGDYDRAGEYLDLQRLPKSERDGALLARGLKIVLDRTLWIDLDALSDAPEGHANDGLPATRDRVGKIKMPDGKSVDILLQRVAREDGVQIWKFSSATVAKISDLYDAFGYGPLGDLLPMFFFDIEFAGVRLWQWIVLVVLLPLAVLAAYLLTWPVVLLLRSLHTTRSTVLLPFATGPLRLSIVVAVLSAAAEPLRLGVSAKALLAALTTALLGIATAWVLLRVVDAMGRRLMERFFETGRTSLIPMLPTIGRVAKGVILVGCAVQMLGSFGFNVTALVAGLGVGGIAVALAAQKTIENLIGGVALYANQPVRVGDSCRFGTTLGTVEEVGLYSTRVRTLERTVVTVPNAQFAAMELENFNRRDKFWYHPRIGLRYETSPDQLRYVLVEIRKLLYAHPRVDHDPARVRFVAFGAYSLDIDIFAYVYATDQGDFLGVAEDLNLRIMDIVAAAGSSFAFPSQTTYIESGDGLDRVRARAAEDTVARWRADRSLCIPGFPQEKIDEVDDTIPYPPAGSALAGTNTRRS